MSSHSLTKSSLLNSNNIDIDVIASKNHAKLSLVKDEIKQICSSFDIIIDDIFQWFEEICENIDAYRKTKNYRLELIRFTSITLKFVKSINSNYSIEVLKDIFSNFILSFNNKLIVIFKKRKYILMNSQNIQETFISMLNQSNLEINILSMIFNHIFKEKNSLDTSIEKDILEEEPNKKSIKQIYLKKVLELYIDNSININNSINSCIINLKSSIEMKYYKILEDNYNNNINTDLFELVKKDNKLKKLTDDINNIITFLTNIDNTLKCEYCNNLLNKSFSSYLSNYYESIKMQIKTSTIEDIFDFINHILIIEDLVNNTFISDDYSHIINKYIFSDLSSVLEIEFNNRLNNLNKKVLDTSYNIVKYNSIFQFFNEKLNIPNFVILWQEISSHCRLSYNSRSNCYYQGCKLTKKIIDEILLALENSKSLTDFLSIIVFLFKIYHEFKVNIIDINENVNKKYEGKNIILLESIDLYNKTINDKITKIFNDKYANKIYQLILFSCLIPSKSKNIISLLNSKDPYNKDLENIINMINIEYSVYVTNISNTNNLNYISESVMFLCCLLKNKDDFEVSLKKHIVKTSMKEEILNYNTTMLKHFLERITNINNLYVSDNITILNEFKKGISISNDYNNLFDDQINNQISTSNLINNLCYLDLKMYPDGITSFNQYNIENDKYKSSSFKQLIKINKNTLKSYYMSKYENRKVLYNDTHSTMELSYTLTNKCKINMIVNYFQADTLFLLQNEYGDICNSLIDSKVILSDELYTNNLDLYKKYHKILNSNNLITLLIKKNICKKIKASFQKSTNEKFDIIEFNYNLQNKKDKNYDFYKIKGNTKDTKKDNNKLDTNNKNDISTKNEKELKLYRSDYVKLIIIKYAKQNKEEYLKKEIIMNITKEKLKDRFDLDLLLFNNVINSLVDDEYLEKKTESINNEEQELFKYIP